MSDTIRGDDNARHGMQPHAGRHLSRQERESRTDLSDLHTSSLLTVRQLLRHRMISGDDPRFAINALPDPLPPPVASKHRARHEDSERATAVTGGEEADVCVGTATISER